MMRQLHQPIRSKDNYVPALSLKRPWNYFVDKFHLSDPEHGADDLDEYEAVLLETDGGRFLLLRYARYPRDMVDVFVPSGLTLSERFLDSIVRELGVPPDAVVRHR
jgi:hypothetical protein